jgi:hypothetical protein
MSIVYFVLAVSTIASLSLLVWLYVLESDARTCRSLRR